MKLYHGSNQPIRDISLDKCRPYKDFGKGFYLTDIREQAEKMAVRTSRIYGGSPTVSTFILDLETRDNSALKIKTFSAPDAEWARFILANRDSSKTGPVHDYDIVIGPVADDTIARLLRLFTDNLIDEEQLLREITFAKITSQYCFLTEEAIKLLKPHE